MDGYTHEVGLSFNFWFLWVVVAVVIAIYVGSQKYFLGRDLRIRARKSDMFVPFAAIAGGVLGVLLFIESYDGLVQIALNGMEAPESVFNADMTAVAEILVFALCFGFMIWVIEGLVSSKYWDYLDNERFIELRMREIEAEARQHPRKIPRNGIKRHHD